ncbi:hypothetical protein BDW22DRAFT_1339549 [Trametopsis cervina]|nr:hypothetical protein BDW22DRAFT_1339549 [Trametopsis cervina]
MNGCGREAKVSDVTTLRRHMDSTHRAAYVAWATANKFLSKLPSDVKLRKEQLLKTVQQTTLDSHLKEMPKRDQIICYTAPIFRRAAIRWVIASDQPISALQHLRFKEMIDIAACATNGVEIPGRKTVRAEIMHMFHEQMAALKAMFAVSIWLLIWDTPLIYP